MMKRQSSEHENLDTELNIVPIIDCFVMLICFLLFTAAFTQLVFLEAKLTSNTAVAAEKSRAELDQFRLVITLEDNQFRLATSGSAAPKYSSAIPNLNNDYDFKGLQRELVKLKTQFPDRFSADIEFKTKQRQIDYERVVKTIDAVRHLSDDDYGKLRVAQKKIRNLDLTSQEAERQVPEELTQLAQALLGNEVAKNTDQKLLFPDVALLGVN
jgi:biopolymer transport protein ExbD